MKNSKIAWFPLLCLLAALVWASGCAVLGRKGQAAVIDKAQSDLYSEKPSVADNAALLLLATDTDSAYRVLRAALAEKNSPTTRAAVIRAFTVEKDPGIRAEMLAALADGNELIVELAKSYLSKVAGESAAPELLSIARDQGKPVSARIAALNVLGKIGSAASVEGIIDVLAGSKGELADAAAAALREITYQPFFETDAETWRLWYKGYRKYTPGEWRRMAASYYRQAEELTARLADSERETAVAWKRYVDLAVESQRYDAVIFVLAQVSSVDAQIYAAQALGKAAGTLEKTSFAKAVPALEEKAKSSDANLAKACVAALGAIGDPSVTPTVEALIRKGDAAVKIAAIKTLPSLPGSDLSILLPFLDDPSAEVRMWVVKSFGARKWAPAVPPLLALLARNYPEPPEVRAAAAEALGEIGDRSAVGVLVVLIKDHDDTVRFAAVSGLRMLADPASFDALIEATRDLVSGVREAAVVALARIGDRRAVDRMLEMVLKDTERAAADQAWTSLQVLVGNDPALILSLSRTLLQAGKLPKAEALLKVLADSSGTSPEVVESRRILAKAYLEAANYQTARVYFQRILDQYPDDADAFSCVTIALRNLDDVAGLANVYARQISRGNAAPETRSYFLGVLNTLLTAGNVAVVAQCCQQVLSASQPGDEAFVSSVRDIQSAALPGYLKSLVAALAADRSARDAIAAYGRLAASALVDGLEDPAEATRAACLELLKSLADGQTFDFDPKKQPGLQQESLAQWRAWAAPAGPAK